VEILLHPFEAVQVIRFRHQHRLAARVIANDGGRYAVSLGHAASIAAAGRLHTRLGLRHQLVAQIDEPAAEERQRWWRIPQPADCRHPAVQMGEKVTADDVHAVRDQLAVGKQRQPSPGECEQEIVAGPLAAALDAFEQKRITPGIGAMHGEQIGTHGHAAPSTIRGGRVFHCLTDSRPGRVAQHPPGNSIQMAARKASACVAALCAAIQSTLLKTSVPFVPPKPKELDTLTLMGISRA
jgi:hypothetical protein